MGQYHNPRVGGSSPSSATNNINNLGPFWGLFLVARSYILVANVFNGLRAVPENCGDSLRQGCDKKPSIAAET